MKLNRSVQTLGLALALTISSLACKSHQYGVTKLPDGGKSGSGIADPGPGGKIGDGGLNSGQTPGSFDTTGIPASNNHQGWPEDRETLKADTVHFDYDSTVIKAGEQPKVAAVADYLKGSSANAVKIEGHCDERGTEEYNRALGERRAIALREELARLGIDPSRIDTISFGRDRPVDKGRSDSAHAKNRRGEFIVLTPK
jgi:peptidoglycan-associated lipoprotein